MEGGIHAEKDGGFLPLGRRNEKNWLKISCPRNYARSGERKKIDAESNKGEPGNQNIRKFRYKNRNADGSGKSYLKQLYGIKLYLH